MTDLLDEARVLVIGGGAVGLSVLYHLTRRGLGHCVLVDRSELTSGSTWHAAGNCPNFSTGAAVMAMQAYSTDLYARLGREVDYPINYHVTGSLRLAHSRDRLDEFHRVAAMARARGLGFEVLTPDEARARYPFLETHDLVGALWDPRDGDIDPSQLTQAFAKGARDAGARIHRFTRVTGLARTATGKWRVETDKGGILADTVVNAAGYRAGELMALFGRRLPMVVMSHQYLVTEAIPELAERTEKLPLLRDPDISYYLRQERDGLILGPYEADARVAWSDGIPDDFAHQLWPDDLDRLEPYIADAIARVPILGTVGVQRVINGPIPYTPDGNPLIGPVRGLPGLFQCCVFSFGIAQAGGAGRVAADWIVDGHPPWDVWSCEASRFGGYATVPYTADRARELYRREYAIAFPADEWPGGRPVYQTPVYPLLADKGARFCARGGWERAAWFARPGDAPEPPPTFREPGWIAAVGEECRAVRDAVGVMDIGGFTKLMVSGAGAEQALDRLLCTRLPGLGRVRLSWALDKRGHILSEFTVTRLAADRFYLVSAASAHEHDQLLVEEALAGAANATVTDLSAAWSTLVLAGPRSRDLLAALTTDAVDGGALPWLAARQFEVGLAQALVLRIGYVGELGYEIHLPLAAARPVYERIASAGSRLGLRDFGVYAMDSLRIEKGYRGWKVDLDRNVSALEAGFGKFIDWSKSFVGREALARQQAEGVGRRLVTLRLVADAPGIAPTEAPVWCAGARVGTVTSSAIGHRVAASLSLALVATAAAKPGTRVDVEMFGSAIPAEVTVDSPYDPENARIRA